MKRFILSMSIVLAAAMSTQAEQKTFYLPDFTVDGLDYEIQQMVSAAIGTVRVNDIEEPYATGTVTIPRTVTYNGATYYVQAVDGYWPMEGGLTKVVVASGVDSVLSGAFASVNEENTDVKAIFRAAMMGHSEMRAGALKAQVMMRQNLRSDSIYGGLLGAALQQGILIRREVSDREVYYQPGAKMYEQQLDFDG